MRPHKLRRLLGAAAVGVVLAGAGIGFAANAHADEQTFIHALTERGLIVYDAPQAIKAGWWVCDQLNITTGDRIAANMYANDQARDFATLDDAAAFVVSAVEELCPWHDHRAEFAPGLKRAV